MVIVKLFIFQLIRLVIINESGLNIKMNTQRIFAFDREQAVLQVLPVGFT